MSGKNGSPVCFLKIDRLDLFFLALLMAQTPARRAAPQSRQQQASS